MKPYSRTINNEYMMKNQKLSSLVINTPYKVDSFTTSPRIAKLLTFPFGLRIDSYSLIKLVFKGAYSISLLMLFSSLCLIGVYLPVQNQNNQLFSAAKSLTNQKLILLAKLNETTTYNKLFSNADSLSLKDSEEIIHIRKNQSVYKPNKSITFKRYPSIEFSGF
ncbi:MAG: hypothetical protein A3I68_04375 [Candidatus Melainabacteria bacterium RIFCSPLOWO2_02_FULL_35_15]|nr:MAG: hypothetical protein A3F80_06185 [Candidatus Melainabacteria bacterium RIFCSPLOWO2_12_FULL_35_11]OGI14489.1 MAG: hypothetical protein A3I68_04375 [Candidatus Melainabacteria bacterium RIFCSPLOWO2_02_FULL_35_15]